MVSDSKALRNGDYGAEFVVSFSSRSQVVMKQPSNDTFLFKKKYWVKRVSIEWYMAMFSLKYWCFHFKKLRTWERENDRTRGKRNHEFRAYVALTPSVLDISYVKTGLLKRSQFSFLFLSSENLKKVFYFFTYILIDYLVHEITKEFWKNSHFENMRADFLLRCPNSLR